MNLSKKRKLARTDSNVDLLICKMKLHETTQFRLISLIARNNSVLVILICKPDFAMQTILRKMCWRRITTYLFVMKIYRTLCCKVKISAKLQSQVKTLKTGDKFVNMLTYHAKRRILLNNQLLKHAVRNVMKNNM